MPLDSHEYLVSQGWQGKGTSLRQGSISRPLLIPQKRTLAGVGKDRDEAFPFWDHLFAAASSAIKISIDSDDDETVPAASSSSMQLQRTKTGIISNRRPTEAIRLQEPTTTEVSPKYSLLSMAKRQAARQGLYAAFYRGPVITSEDIIVEDMPLPVHQESHERQPKKKRKLDEKQQSHSMETTKSPPAPPPVLNESSLSAMDKAERKRLKREGKEARRKAKELAMAWMKHAPCSEPSLQERPPKKKRKRTEGINES